MVDKDAIRSQILSNISQKNITVARTYGVTAKKGAFAKEISDAILKSDVRMHCRRPYAFNGKYYEQLDEITDDNKEFNAMLIKLMYDLKFGSEFIVNYRKTVIDFCTDTLVEKNIKPLKHIVPFQNCLLNTITMEVMPHSPVHDNLYCLSYDYSRDAQCPKWKSFLAQVLPTKGLVEVLQEFLGLLFVDRSEFSLEKMPILFGGGSNGKSVVADTITGVLGKLNVSANTMGSLTKASTAEYNLAHIDGKILNICNEIEPKEFSSETFKILVSGQPIMARKIFGSPTELKNVPLFMGTANKLPETSDKSKGYFRRLMIIPFDVTIKDKDQDKQLTSKLRCEYAGILNWIIEGRTRILKNKIQFTEVSEIHNIEEGYRVTQDSVYGFLRTNRIEFGGEKEDKYSITDKDLFSNYCDYSKAVSKIPYGINVFIGNMITLGYKKLKGGFRIYCDRDPSHYWNQDIGGLYDEECDEDDELPKEVDEYKPIMQKIPF